MSHMQRYDRISELEHFKNFCQDSGISVLIGGYDVLRSSLFYFINLNTIHFVFKDLLNI